MEAHIPGYLRNSRFFNSPFLQRYERRMPRGAPHPLVRVIIFLNIFLLLYTGGSHGYAHENVARVVNFPVEYAQTSARALSLLMLCTISQAHALLCFSVTPKSSPCYFIGNVTVVGNSSVACVQTSARALSLFAENVI